MMMVPTIDGLTHFIRTDTDFGAACKNARTLASNHKKAFIISSAIVISSKTSKPAILSCFDEVLNGEKYQTSAMAGMFLGNLGPRKKGVGFYSQEYPAQWLYHYPGFDGNSLLGIAADELSMMIAIETRAINMAALDSNNGNPVGTLELPPYVPESMPPPKLISTSINYTENYIKIVWFGTPGAIIYTIGKTVQGVYTQVMQFCL
jgi:hypothetical protein